MAAAFRPTNGLPRPQDATRAPSGGLCLILRPLACSHGFIASSASASASQGLAGYGRRPGASSAPATPTTSPQLPSKPALFSIKDKNAEEPLLQIHSLLAPPFLTPEPTLKTPCSPTARQAAS